MVIRHCYTNSKFSELLVKYASPEDKVTQDKVLKTLSDYCDRPVTNYTLDRYPVDYEWSFFHSFWFSFITCSTVGKAVEKNERIKLFR